MPYKLAVLQIGVPDSSVYVSLASTGGVWTTIDEVQRQGSIDIDDTFGTVVRCLIWLSPRTPSVTVQTRIYNATNAQVVIGPLDHTSQSMPIYKADAPLSTWPAGDAKLQVQYSSTVACTYGGAIVTLTRGG